MLEELTVKNFQSHKDSKAILHPGINIFTGPSDAGKSSFAIRSFEWLRKNRPRGTPFKTKNAKGGVEVSATFDGITATRIRSTAINQYKLSNIEEPFDVVGSDVPKEITQFLNINDSLIQGQHDKYFLLQDSPGKVAEKLNKITNLDIIDYVTKEVNSTITENRKEVTYTKNEIKRLEQDIEKYKHLDRVEILLSNLSKKVQEHSEKQEVQDGIEVAIGQIAETTEAIAGLDDWLTIEKEIQPIFKLANEEKIANDEYQKLSGTIEGITQLQTHIERLLEQAGADVLVEGIAEYASERESLKTALGALGRSIEGIEDSTKRSSCLSKDIQDLTKQATDLIKKTKTCPLCGGEIGVDAIKHIKGWL